MANSLTLKEHQEIMLKMMIEFDKYCNHNGLRYFIAYGTLLGAVRHKGFIPWDDDVDIVMPRPDYERLLLSNSISKDTEIVSYRNPHNYYHPFSASVITDKNTIMKEKLVKKQTGKGIFCDIFPLDGLPENSLIKKYHLIKLRILQTLIGCAGLIDPKVSGLKSFLKVIIGKIMSTKNIRDYIEINDKIAQSYGYDNSSNVVHSVTLFNHPERFLASKEEYGDYVLLEFEGYKFRAPVGYKTILKRAYGDYMKLPPENERLGHHGIEIYRR